MTWYELLLFIHIGGSIVWIGAGFLSLVLATTYDRESDEAAIRRFLHDQEWLAMKLFVPASLIVVVMGIALVIESDAWTFDYLWIVLGLVGYAATFVTGFFFIRPASERIGADMEQQGGRLTPELRVRIRKLIVMARVDYVTFALVGARHGGEADRRRRRRADRDGADPGGRDRLHPRQPARDRRAGGAALERLGQDQVAVAELVEAIAGRARGVV